MKTGALIRLYSILAVMIIGVGVAGCGGDDTPDSNGADNTTDQSESMAVTLPKTYDGPQIDSSVSAEDGGIGFEEIAESRGWQTGTINEETYRNYIADPSARKGGMLVSAIIDYPAVIRPIGEDANTTTIALLENLIYEPLIDLNPLTLEFIPILATHWKVSEDGQTYFFRLNPQARFSDGYPVTTDDVLATYKLITDKGTRDPFTVQWFGGKYDSPQKISTYVFSVRSKEKNWKNMLYFGGRVILPAHIIGDMSGEEFIKKYKYDTPLGSGPYTVLREDVKTQSTLTLTRISDWWRKDAPLARGQYNFDRIKLVKIADYGLQVQRFLAGELDFYAVNRAQWWKDKFNGDEFERGIAKKRKIYNDNPQGLQGWAFNTRRAPFDDPLVREALILLIPRQELIEKIMHNEYHISDSYFSNSPYENPNNPKYRYNPEKAIGLLKEAGYTKHNSEGILVNEKTGKPFVFELPLLKGSEHIMEPVQQKLKDVGIKMEIRFVDFAQRTKLTDERKFDVAYVAYSGIVFPNPFGQLHSSMAAEQNTNNITGFSNTVADSLIDIELTTFDHAERLRQLQMLDSIFMAEKHYALAWYAPFTRVVYWSYLSQPKHYISKVGDYRDIFQYWWYEAEKRPTVEKGRQDKSVTMAVGETDVMFWPDYKKRAASSATTGSSLQ